SRFLGDRLTVVWHAGEPLVLPPAYYAEAFDTIERLRPPGLALDHSFQSNGTRLTEAWVDFIKARQIRIGLSIDGPAWLHDAHRRSRSGRGSHAAAMAAAARLRAAAVDFHVIAVLTATALRHPEALFAFFHENGLHRLGFNVEEIEAAHSDSSLAGAGATTAYQAFLRRFIACNEATGWPIDLREASAFVAQALGPPRAGPDNMQVEPLRILSVDARGNLSGFSPELLGAAAQGYDDFLFGNIHDISLETALTGPRFTRLRDEIAAGVARCRASCPYFTLCGGGAPSNKFFETGRLDSTETLYCRLTKQATAEVMLDELEAAFGIAGCDGDLARPAASG
ncbi:MAG TPA: cyclophane-forming radical SAM/SPASM peptide maturase GrrM/OscB, partial [Kiloniellaceae bacterium]|nr:cyclophane-forming radical SAM/SPASM peptide maturase GrrM/OscB [Kiloniellaceae bacterium]